MEVFLIPVGRDRYELYCEVPDDDPAEDPGESRGFVNGIVRRFRELLAAAERERRQPSTPPPGAADTWFARQKRRALCRVAEAVAEQRLLWHMRRQHDAVAVHPEDLSDAQAMTLVNLSMQADFEKHRFWLIVNAIAFVLSGALVLIPGPNVLAYYFGFRIVGHYLSLRGARQALKVVRWSTRASGPLTELRQAIALDSPAREARVRDIAARLHLERLAPFFLRTAVRGA